MFTRMLCALVACGIVAGDALAEPKNYLKKSDAWFAESQAKSIAENILSFQSETGGWPKNQDTTSKPYTGDRTKLKGTYDNGATTDELRFLARIYNATKELPYRDAFDRGLDYILDGQYPNGGWPQFSPPGKGYARHITFNDGAMVRLLNFLREVANSTVYEFVDVTRRKAAGKSIDLGIECILRCQIVIDGKRTVWCAQHDEIDFRPQSARSYELATLSGSESVGITRFLMSLENPSEEIIESVEAAVEWFDKAAIKGIRVETQNDPSAPKGFNRVVIHDESAPPLWARFYDLQTQAPVFVDRDGVPRRSLSEIGYERRNGYAWYGNWPQKLLGGEYQKWKMNLK